MSRLTLTTDAEVLTSMSSDPTWPDLEVDGLFTDRVKMSSPPVTRETPMTSSFLSSSPPRLMTYVAVVVLAVVLNVGQVGSSSRSSQVKSWSSRSCCELTQDAHCRRVCLRVCRLSVCTLVRHWDLKIPVPLVTVWQTSRDWKHFKNFYFYFVTFRVILRNSSYKTRRQCEQYKWEGK